MPSQSCNPHLRTAAQPGGPGWGLPRLGWPHITQGVRASARIPVQDTPTLNHNAGITYRHPKTSDTGQGIRAVWGAFLSPLSAATRKGSSAPCGLVHSSPLPPLQGCSFPWQDSGKRSCHFRAATLGLCLQQRHRSRSASCTSSHPGAAV